MATGHYCKIEERNGRKVIVKAEDDKKDQTYMMYNLKQYQLERTIMPCGEYKKDHIREIAENIGLDVYNKKIAKRYALYQIMIMVDLLKEIIKVK